MKKRDLYLLLTLGIMILFSGCGLRMTTEEKVELFLDGEAVKIADDIKIEQLEKLQFPQMTANAQLYSEEMLGKLFLGLSEEEIERQKQEYYRYLIDEHHFTRELAELENAPISKEESSASRYDKGFYYKAFSDAQLYDDAVHLIDHLLFSNANGIPSNTEFRYESLSSVFQKESLEGCTKEQAKQNVDPVAEELGFSSKESELYVLDVDSLNRIREITELPVPVMPKGEEGAATGNTLSTWTKEQEVYLILYKRVTQDRTIESVASESILFAYYHPEQKIIFMKTNGPIPGMSIKEEMKTVIPGEEAVQMAGIYILEHINIECTITGAEFSYTVPYSTVNIVDMTMVLEPCWKVMYRYTASGKDIEDHILLNARSGEIVDNGTPY